MAALNLPTGQDKSERPADLKRYQMTQNQTLWTKHCTAEMSSVHGFQNPSENARWNGTVLLKTEISLDNRNYASNSCI